MSRGPGRAQRFVLEHLAAHPPHWHKRIDLRPGKADYDEYDEGWRSVVDIAAYWHHDQTCQCGNADDCRNVTWDLPRAEVESIRRAVKTLARAGRVETCYDWTGGETGARRLLCARLPLSVEQADSCALAQHLREERARQASADLAPLLSKLR